MVNVVEVQCDLRRGAAKQGQKYNSEAERSLGQALSDLGGIQEVPQSGLPAIDEHNVSAMLSLSDR